MLAIAIAGCGPSKTAVRREYGAPVLPPHYGPVCLLWQRLPPEIPATNIGKVAARRSPTAGEHPLDVLARGVREAGGNAVYVGDQSRGAAWGHAVFFDPSLRLDCIAAGGEIR